MHYIYVRLNIMSDLYIKLYSTNRSSTITPFATISHVCPHEFRSLMCTVTVVIVVLVCACMRMYTSTFAQTQVYSIHSRI